MKLKTKKGEEFLIDDEDFSKIKDYKWHIHTGKCKYKYLSSIIDKKLILLHRLITNCPRGREVDHINNDGLDNRKCNLRICTHSENIMNSKRNSRNTTGFKGVSLVGRKFLAQLVVNKKYIYIGIFNTITSATRAYNNAAIKYHGEFAQINKI